jgi:hypothetical protein
MTPACSISQEESPLAKPVPYLHSHPFPMTPDQYERFLVVLDFAFPRWDKQFTLRHDDDGCVVSKALFATTHQVTGAIKAFLVMDADRDEISLPCVGEAH